MLLRLEAAEDVRLWRRAMAASDSRAQETPWTFMSRGPVRHVRLNWRALLSPLGSRLTPHVRARTPFPWS
jgi:hypothetical protein